MDKQDQLTAIATAAETVKSVAKKSTPTNKVKLLEVVADLERMVMELQKGE